MKYFFLLLYHDKEKSQEKILQKFRRITSKWLPVIRYWKTLVLVKIIDALCAGCADCLLPFASYHPCDQGKGSLFLSDTLNRLLPTVRVSPHLLTRLYQTVSKKSTVIFQKFRRVTSKCLCPLRGTGHFQLMTTLPFSSLATSLLIVQPPSRAARFSSTQWPCIGCHAVRGSSCSTVKVSVLLRLKLPQEIV